MAACLAAAAAVLAGCATVPTSGQPRAVVGAIGQIPQFVQPIPPVPQAGWTQTQIVSGFLAASASFTDQHAAAQQFLSPAARRTFQLSRWPVTVVSGLQPVLPVSAIEFGPRSKGLPQILEATLTTQQVATISDIGQYVYGRSPRTYRFTLVRSGGQWRINSMSPQALLLSPDSFVDAYQPRNLYFWSPGYVSPVPEPVYAPQEDTYAAAAASLVNALLGTNPDQGSSQQDRTWLAGATQTAFPPGTTLIGNKVTIAGQTAIVNLGGAAAKASLTQLQYMDGQLVTTLTSTSYGSPAIARHVELEVNGQLRANLARPTLPGSVPAAGPLYYLASDGAVTAWNGQASQAIRNPAGRGQITFAQIAVLNETSAQLLAGSVSSGRGCGVYHGPLLDTAALTLSVVPDADSGPCSSVSWDSQGDIWAVTTNGIWILPAGQQQFVPLGPAGRLSLPLLPGDSPASYHVLALQVAPDAVRVAMIVQVDGPASSRGGPQVVMAAVSHSGGHFVLGSTVGVGPTLVSPVALSWLDPDHLVVLADSELYSVPVNGGVEAPIETVPTGADAVAATGPGRIAVAGGGHIWTLSGLGQPVQHELRGTSAAYQG